MLYVSIVANSAAFAELTAAIETGTISHDNAEVKKAKILWNLIEITNKMKCHKCQLTEHKCTEKMAVLKKAARLELRQIHEIKTDDETFAGLLETLTLLT